MVKGGITHFDCNTFLQKLGIWLKINRTSTLKLFTYADWKTSKLCDYLAYELGKTFIF